MDKYDSLLKMAEDEMLALKHPYVGTEHLMLAILKDKSKLSEYLKTRKLTYKKFKNKLINIIGVSNKKSEYILYTPMLRAVIKRAVEVADENNAEVDEVGLFNAIIDEGEGIAIRIMVEMHIDIRNIRYNEGIKFQCGVIINDIVKEEKILGREEEIANIIQILLRKNKCNPLLIGKAGVGKSAIIEELARRINKKKIISELSDYKILKIDFASVVAGTKYRGEFEEKITNILNEVAKHKNVILFVDEAHTIVNAGGAEGAISAGDIFKPFLARGDIKLIGATTINEYHKYFETDKALARRFQTVMIEEPTNEETRNILDNVKNEYEAFHNIKINDEVLKKILEFSSNFLKNKANPDKSLEILDTLCTRAKYEEKLEICKEDVDKLLISRYHVNYQNADIQIMNALKNTKGLAVRDMAEIREKLDKIYNYNLYSYIDINSYDNDYANFQLIGYPHNVDKEYVLRKYIDNPFGVIFLKNYEYGVNKTVDKIIENRYIVDNLGNDIDFHNVLFVIENKKRNNTIGFIRNEKKDNYSKYFSDYETKECLTL